MEETTEDWLCAFSQWKKLPCELEAFLLVRISSDLMLHRQNDTSPRKLKQIWNHLYKTCFVPHRNVASTLLNPALSLPLAMTKARTYFKNCRVLVLHLQLHWTPTQTMRLLYNLTLWTWPGNCNPSQLDGKCSWRHHILCCFVWVFCWWLCVCFPLKQDTEFHSFCYDTTGFCCIRTS